MNIYTSLFLDIDNTLLDFNMAEKFAIKKTLKAHCLPFDDETITEYSKINKSYWESFERGEIPKSAIYEGRFETLLKFLNKTADIKTLSVDYCNNLSEGYFKVDGAIKLLKYLRAKKYKLYATTNGLFSTQLKRIKFSGLEPFFDRVFVSEEAGHQKPEKEYFDYVISKIDEKNKSKMLIIGDSQSSDILGGINSGIETCWFNPNHEAPKYKSKYEVNSLEEIKNIL